MWERHRRCLSHKFGFIPFWKYSTRTIIVRVRIPVDLFTHFCCTSVFLKGWGATCLVGTGVFKVGCKTLEKVVLPGSSLVLRLWYEIRLDLVAMNIYTCQEPVRGCQKFAFPRTGSNFYTYCLYLQLVPAPLPWRTKLIVNSVLGNVDKSEKKSQEVWGTLF